MNVTRSTLVGPIVVVLLSLSSTAGAARDPNGYSSREVIRVLIDQGDSNVLYAATRLGPQAPEHGVFKSTDQGQSWFTINDGLPLLSDGLPQLDVRSLAMDPQDSNTLYVGLTDDSIFKSIDGGGWWSGTGRPGVYTIHDIAIDPLDSNTVFAAGDGVFSYSKSTDGGATWLSSGGIGHVLSWAIDPSDSQTIYAGVFSGVVGGTVFKSVDGGGQWTRANQGLPDSPLYVVVIDPQNPNVIYAGNAQYGLYKSTDGAAQWNVSLSGRLMDAHCLAIDPVDSSTMYACTYEAATNPNRIYKTTDGGDTWYEADSGIVTQTWTWFFSLAIDPHDSTTVYAGTSRGIFKSLDAGESWFPIGP